MTIRLYILIVFGNAFFTGFNGGMTVWQNDFIEEYFNITPILAVTVSGAITIFNGVISTMVGAVINDKRVLAHKTQFPPANE